MTNAEQIAAIQKIMSKPPEVPFYRFRFGQFKGVLLENVVSTKEGRDYLKWLYNNKEDLPKKVDGYIAEQKGNW